MLKADRFVFLRAFVVCYAGFSGVQAIAAPNFTIAATNVTMPQGGNPGSSSFTLTAGSGYSGLVTVDCDYTGAEVRAGAEVTAKVPTCWILAIPISTWNRIKLLRVRSPWFRMARRQATTAQWLRCDPPQRSSWDWLARSRWDGDYTARLAVFLA